ncbi:MAG: cyclic nucleotide-binding domain-containing protein [Desulfobulbaceae bacterium]|nr:cyclic nucleotide-binding domain-containing protein [Desulfobulbaceae bacterium]
MIADHHTPSPDQNSLLAELPLKFYSALRTRRLYPASNPQIQKSAESVLACIKKLFSPGAKTISLGHSSGKILVKGEQLSQNDQERPQIQGLVTLLDRLQIHSISFHRHLNGYETALFLAKFADSIGTATPIKPLKEILEELGIHSISLDEKRYVAVGEGEQVVNAEQFNAGLIAVSDEELTNFVLGQTGLQPGQNSLPTHIMQELHARLPENISEDLTPLDFMAALINILQNTVEADWSQGDPIKTSAATLTRFTPVLLSRLIAALPENQVADDLLDTTVSQLSKEQLVKLIAGFMQTDSFSKDQNGSSAVKQSSPTLERLTKLGRGAEIKETIALQTDAKILQHPSTEKNVLTPDIKARMQQPDWPTSTLVAAVLQLVEQQKTDSEKIKPESFNYLLANFEQLLDTKKQEQVAGQAGSKLASMEDEDLGLILLQRFKGLFGEQLHAQVINQISDEKFARIIKEMQRIGTDSRATTANLDDQELQESYDQLIQTVRGEKLRALLELHKAKDSGSKKQDMEKIKEGLKQLLQGDFTVFADQELTHTLPGTVIRLLDNGKDEAADNLLGQMVRGLQTLSGDEQQNAVSCLAETAGHLGRAAQWPRLDKLLPALEQGFLACGSEELKAGQPVAPIELLAEHYLNNGAWDQAADTLSPLLKLITSGSGEDSSTCQQAKQALERLTSLPVMEEALEEYLSFSEHHEEAGRLLAVLGKKSAELLMKRLGKSENRAERDRLLALIKNIGKPARDTLIDQLRQPFPWYVTRNIIRLLGNVGDPACLETIAPFLEHKDERIQLEVLSTIGRIGGAARKNFFLRALGTVSERLQTTVVNQLGTIPDHGLVMPLAELLEKSKLSQAKNKDELQLALCRALGKIGSKKAIPTLKNIKKTENSPGIANYSDRVCHAAEAALLKIQTTDTSIPESKLPQSSSPRSISMSIRKNDPLANREANIFRMAAGGQKKEALQELFDLIVERAKDKDFHSAERLRERLYEIDSMALSEIIRSGEIIEQEKTGAIGEDKLEIWSELLDILTQEEFSAIYHELEERTFKPEETIVNQGDTNGELFFINHGSLKVSYMQGEREIFVKSLNRGQIAGENFFNASFWTVNLTTLTSARISVLKQKNFSRWHEEYPGLESKLKDFYNRFNDIHDLLKKKKLDRREHERFKLSRKVQIQMIDHNGKPIGRGFRGELADFSKGGLAFLIRISNQANARLLLGRVMRVTIPVGGEPDRLHMEGLAISIQPFHLLESDFSVHLKFNKILEQDTLQTLLG